MSTIDESARRLLDLPILRHGFAPRRLGHPMHEATTETNAFRLQLVFHDIRIEETGEDVNVYDQITTPIEE